MLSVVSTWSPRAIATTVPITVLCMPAGVRPQQCRMHHANKGQHSYIGNVCKAYASHRLSITLDGLHSRSLACPRDLSDLSRYVRPTSIQRVGTTYRRFRMFNDIFGGFQSNNGSGRCFSAVEMLPSHRGTDTKRSEGSNDYGCVPPFTRGVIGHETGLVLGRALKPFGLAHSMLLSSSPPHIP